MRDLFGVTALLFVGALLSQLSSTVGYLMLLGDTVAFVLMVLVVLKALRPGQRVLLLTLPVLWATVMISGKAIYGVPHWVKSAAAPSIEALEQIKVHAGQYPDENALSADVRAVLKTSQCFSYRRTPEGFRLICQGVFMTKCDYDSATQHWSSWD